MSEENIDKLRRIYEAYNRGDYDDAISIMHPDVEFFPTGGQPPYRGTASVRRWMEPDAFEQQVVEPLEFVSSRQKVLVRTRTRGRGAGSGIELEVDGWNVWTFDDAGFAVRIEAYLDHDEGEALEAAGLSE